ncbi:hypothetical protein JW979_05750, partial [bacterium]|nr:hypothetical protein [candidate division CSSED10-310 bacterium]
MCKTELSMKMSGVKTSIFVSFFIFTMVFQANSITPQPGVNLVNSDVSPVTPCPERLPSPDLNPWKAPLNNPGKYRVGTPEPPKCETPTPTPPETPDENHSKGSGRRLVKNVYGKGQPSTSLMGVYQPGYYAMGLLLQSLHRHIGWFASDFIPILIIEESNVLIFPSGTLRGAENSEIFKQILDVYVHEYGGTLVVFAQQHGYEFGVLPGGEVAGYGWLEDQSCQTNSIGFEQYHQGLSSITTTNISCNVDGYFTDFPENAHVLLRRTINGYPAMIAYQYGEGIVIATTIYDDLGWFFNQSTPDGVKIVRDLVTWGIDSQTLPDFTPEENISLSVPVSNETGFDVSAVRLRLMDPDRDQEVATLDVPLTLSPGESGFVDYLGPSQSLVGIWSVDYALLDAGSNIIQAYQDGARFVVSDPPESVTNPDFYFWITAPEEIPVNEETVFMVHITNNTEDERTVEPRWWWNHETAISLGDFTVGAGSTEQIPVYYTVTATGRFWTAFYEDPEVHLGTASKGVRCFSPVIGADVYMDKPAYQPSEHVVTWVDMHNAHQADQDVNVQFSAQIDENRVFIQSGWIPATVPGSSSEIVYFEFDLPSNAAPGYRLLQVEIRDAGTDSVAGMGSAVFELGEALLIVRDIAPENGYHSGSQNMTMQIENRGNVPTSGDIYWLLHDPEGVFISSGSNSFSV